MAEIDDLQDAFETRVRGLARSFTAGEITLADWHTRTAGAVRLFVTIAHLSGTKGARVGFVAVNQEVRRQQAFLSRFADEIAVSRLRGQPMSEAQIANRASLYGGAGRAVNQRAVESVGPRGGVLYEYRAVDSPTTCGPCLAAEGVYGPSEGPYPGEVCLGRGRCRCRRVRIEQRAA